MTCERGNLWTDPERCGASVDESAFYNRVLEQYKIAVESAHAVSSWREAANRFYLSVVLALFMALGWMYGSEGSSLPDESRRLISIAGMVVALAWFALVTQYRNLNSAKFAVIQRLEERLPARVFSAEWEALGRGKTLKYVPVSHIEQLLPLIAVVGFVVTWFWPGGPSGSLTVEPVAPAGGS